MTMLALQDVANSASDHGMANAQVGANRLRIAPTHLRMA